VRTKIRNAWYTVNGLITLTDILNKLGLWLYRGTARRTIGVAIALGTVFLLGKSDTLNTINFKQALTGTGSILILSCIGGILLMALSGQFARSQLVLAEAKGANLLEDMKRSRAAEHCERLWLGVFKYEQARFTEKSLAQESKLINDHQDELVRLCHPNTERSTAERERRKLRRIMRRLGRTEAGWELAYDYSIGIAHSRSALKYHLRYDLCKIRDWYDGAPFHHTDTKLPEQFDASGDLQAAKHDIGLNWLFKLQHTHRRLVQLLWFKALIRAIQLRVSAACRHLDSRFNCYHFAPDQFLWPSDETHEIVRQQVGEQAVRALIDLRRSIFHRVLRPEPELAQKLMQRAIYPNFDAATQLRRRYDPEYVLDELDETWLNDLRQYNRAFKPVARAQAKRRLFQQRTALQQAALTRFVEATAFAETWTDDAEARRAIRIAMHADCDGLCPAVMRHQGGDPTDAKLATGAIQAAVAEKKQYTHKLIAVRVHHELARIELRDYEHYLDRILN
jgi:hypothetical protein